MQNHLPIGQLGRCVTLHCFTLQIAMTFSFLLSLSMRTNKGFVGLSSSSACEATAEICRARLPAIEITPFTLAQAQLRKYFNPRDSCPSTAQAVARNARAAAAACRRARASRAPRRPLRRPRAPQRTAAPRPPPQGWTRPRHRLLPHAARAPPPYLLRALRAPGPLPPRLP